MADIVLPVLDPGRGGSAATYKGGSGDALTATDTYKVPNNGHVVLHITNGGTAGTVTIQTPGNVDGNAISDKTVAIAAIAELFLGPYPPEVYNGVGHRLSLTFATPTTIKVAAIRARL